MDQDNRPGNRPSISRRTGLASGLALAVAGRARAADSAPLRLGILGDLSGPTRDVSGPGTLVLVRRAIADAKAAGLDVPVEVVQADHQHKVDVGTGIARRWLDTGEADVILEVNNSAIALGVADLVEAKDRTFLATGAATSDLSGSHCNANTIHWTYDTWMLGNCTGSAVTKAGGDSWFIVAPDYAFGQALGRDTAAAVARSGGQVKGSSFYPFPSTSDFSSFLLAAQASGAKVVALASSGTDVQNFVKQAREFGLTNTLVPLQGLLQDVHAIGVDTAKGLLICDPWYWDLNQRTRRLTQAVLPAMPPGLYPSAPQVGAYSAVMHCLKAASAMGGAAEAKRSGRALVVQMKTMPTDDDALGVGRVREDGRKIHDVYLFRVRDPGAVKMGWDLLDLVTTIPAEQAFRPMADGGCKLVRA